MAYAVKVEKNGKYAMLMCRGKEWNVESIAALAKGLGYVVVSVHRV